MRANAKCSLSILIGWELVTYCSLIRATGFPLLWLYIEHPFHLDFVRLLGQQQDVAVILDSEF